MRCIGDNIFMYLDDELVMISALQHCLFCRRQCALIHIEGVWQENYLTASGRILHNHVDEIGAETRRDVHIATALRLVSYQLGVMGVADRVEFHKVVRAEDEVGHLIATRLLNKEGWWQPYPVEFKRGKAKTHRADEVQLCAQAICLEEMLRVTIKEGALFYGKPRRRIVVSFDEELRALTESVARDVHQLLSLGVTPPPAFSKSCESCSLNDLCFKKSDSVRVWILNQVKNVME